MNPLGTGRGSLPDPLRSGKHTLGITNTAECKWCEQSGTLTAETIVLKSVTAALVVTVELSCSPFAAHLFCASCNTNRLHTIITRVSRRNEQHYKDSWLLGRNAVKIYAYIYIYIYIYVLTFLCSSPPPSSGYTHLSCTILKMQGN
jgi:hypothetical protein